MTNNEILNEIKELKQKLKELENKAQNLEENEYKRWRAELKEDYWYIDCIGNIYDDYEAFEEEDNFKYAIGNYFQTQQEAQEYKDNLITKQKLKDLALRLNKGVEIDWDYPNQYKYNIVFNNETKCLDLEYNIIFRCLNATYCLDINFLDIAKEEIGEEALIKLIKSGV